jgi:hypothetical protein
MLIKYKLKEIAQDIYLCTIKDQYDLTMTFCRLQEFYESPHKEIRNKKFKLLDFIRLYTKRRKEEVFTYPEDWVGFNVPSIIIENLYKLGIDDYNDYDRTIENIHKSINKSKYYLIAATTNDTTTIEHELCHALYYLNKDYKKVTDTITSKLPLSVYKKISKFLINLGYTKHVLKDEVQAYLSTDSEMFKEIKMSKKDKITLLKIKTQLKFNFLKYKKAFKIKLNKV